MEIFAAAGAPIVWDVQEVGKEVDPRTNSFITKENIDSVLVGAARGGWWVLGGPGGWPQGWRGGRAGRARMP